MRRRDRDRAEALRLAGGPQPTLRERAVALDFAVVEHLGRSGSCSGDDNRHGAKHAIRDLRLLDGPMLQNDGRRANDPQLPDDARGRAACPRLCAVQVRLERSDRDRTGVESAAFAIRTSKDA
jgi:hypothetical protein